MVQRLPLVLRYADCPGKEADKWADCVCFLNFSDFYFQATVFVKSKVQIIHLSKAKQSVILFRI